MDDVCLFLEGTYPYVAGGVSTWVYNLINRLRDVTFSIVYLGAHRHAAKKLHYEIPPNVRDFREYYIFDYAAHRERKRRPRPRDFEVIGEFILKMRRGDLSMFGEVSRVMGDPKTRSVDLFDLIHSRQGWDLLRELYRKEETEVSFIDYFWSWRFLYMPLFSLLRAEIPPARVYHSVSTGYAGMMGALGKLRHRRPYLITEHGIYTRERKIDISTSDWIYSPDAEELKVTERRDFFREWWISLFEGLSRLAYEQADQIITLFEGNRRVQIEEGADPEKTSVIPNGIDIPAAGRNTGGRDPARPRIGFVGRVVPIKDVKTFIRACKIIHFEIPEAEIYVLGPTDEDEDYFKECRLLAQMSGLENVLKFEGKVRVSDYYPKLDVLVLTSISEGQPLAVLEGYGYGIPAVATDVGSCSEIICGQNDEDRLLGPSGIITPICDAGATARGVLQILKNPGLREQMAGAGRRRVKKYYELNELLGKYQDLYSYYMERVCW